MRATASDGAPMAAKLQRELPEDLAAALLFRQLWDALVDLVGTQATAALLRRAIKRAAARSPGAALPNVERQGLDHVYSTPASWQDGSSRDAVDDLRRLAREDLAPLFREFTGPVIERRLAQVPELVAAGIAGEEEGA